MSGRLVIWEIAAPSANERWNAARSAGAEFMSCRSSSISMFGVRCLTQIIEPAPSASSAIGEGRAERQVRPEGRDDGVGALRDRRLPDLEPT